MIKIYTDGSARGNPGKAGWGVIILEENNKGLLKVEEMGGSKLHATNNQMELTAPIEALKHLKKKYSSKIEVEIFSDSKYVILGINEWIENWIKNNWKNSAKKPVLNRELWEELHALTKEIKSKWHYVKGHAGHKYNERADEIATSFADQAPVELRRV
jgi:ribonuclease HI